MCNIKMSKIIILFLNKCQYSGKKCIEQDFNEIVYYYTARKIVKGRIYFAACLVITNTFIMFVSCTYF